MAATSSPYSLNSGNNISVPVIADLELSATPGQFLKVLLPQNAARLYVEIRTDGSHDVDVNFDGGSTKINIPHSTTWICPFTLPASQILWISSTHASATVQIRAGLSA